MAWFLCVIIVIAFVIMIRAWRDNKEKWHLFVVVLLILIVLIVPCFLRLAGVAVPGLEGH